MMEYITVFGSLVLLTVGAHAWGIGSTKPVDCSVSGWGDWSKPFFGGLATRERLILRNAAHGGKPCPNLIETQYPPNARKNTTKEIAKVFADKFILRSASTLSDTKTKVRDLLVILDASGSITAPHFKLAVEQIAELLKCLCPENVPFDNNVQKLAVLRYSSSVQEIFDFKAHKTTSATINALKKVSYVGRSTNTAEAFKRAKDMFTALKGARVSNTNVEPEVLILTDGRSDNAVASIKAAKELKSTAKVFGLIIGNFGKDGHKELVQYVSYPAQDHLFNLPNFVELRDLLKYVKASISTHKCAPFDLS